MIVKNEAELKRLFGYHIKIRRESRLWSQEDLAEKAKVSKNTISDIETGDKFVHAKTLVKLAIAFETEVYELFKPDYILPDKNTDIIAKYGEEVRDAVEKVGIFYRGNVKVK